MSDELDRGLRYRNYSEELRVIAAEASPATRGSLLMAADEYIQLARSLESIHRAKVATGQRLRPNGPPNIG